MRSILRNFREAEAGSRAACTWRVVLAGLAVLLAAPALAAPPVASTDLAVEEKAGVTLYQASGLKGSIPLKKVYKVDPSGDTGHYELEFASAGMNTQMQIMAKFVVPAGMTFKSFEVRTTNGPTQVTPAGADKWDGQTIIDKVTVSPWNLNRVLQQCVQQLQQPDGSFKDSATFDLVADSTEVVRGKGIATPPNAPPGSATSATGTVKPKTRVTAYIVAEDRKGADGREAGRLRTESPARKPPTAPATRKPVRPAATADTLKPGTSRKPQAASSGRLTARPSRPVPAKERFERTKPHVNVSGAASEASRKIRAAKP
jgi:hypothetical protein